MAENGSSMVKLSIGLRKSRFTRGVVLIVTIVASASISRVTCAKSPEKITSVYTSLTTKNKCKLASLDDEGTEPGYARGSLASCPGIGGNSVHVEDADGRMTLYVIAPNKNKFNLNYPRVVLLGFSELGDKAEWRVTTRAGKLVPLGLIVRVTSTNGEVPKNKIESYLAVAKITPSEICVTDRIPARRTTANTEARRAADTATTKKCLAPIRY